jgi:pantoate--beta-alanine ligase
MKLFTNKKKLQKEIKNINNISFVPTMGALHKGHQSLIKKSVRESKKTLVSIFVNPKQFENKKDFKNYPKNYKSDIKILKRLKVNYLYKPSYEDIYKFKTENKIFLDRFSKKLCGKFRKGHFRGVVNVLNRLLEIIKPKKILLGNKDFQQLILIKKHIKKNGINTKIIPYKTMRDKNFIAYSSRLKRLKNHEKTNLVAIIRFLRSYKKNLTSKKVNFNFSKIKNKILSLGAKKVDYVEIIDLKTLKKPKKNKFNLFFAFYIGKVRFIDNF